MQNSGNDMVDQESSQRNEKQEKPAAVLGIEKDSEHLVNRPNCRQHFASKLAPIAVGRKPAEDLTVVMLALSREILCASP
jgi:hypothetical protein